MNRCWRHHEPMLVICAFAGACGGGSQSEPRPEEAPMPNAYDPAYAASLDEDVDPRISTSGGEQGGLVVLWPRVAPASGADAQSGNAASIQDALVGLARQVAGQRPVDVRPEPQRVCPQGGCVAASVGAVLVFQDQGCVAAATVSLPGRSPARIVPWAGGIQLRNSVVQFREPPESQLVVRDFMPCSDLAVGLDANGPDIAEAIREVLRD